MILFYKRILFISLAVILTFSLISNVQAFVGPGNGQTAGSGGGLLNVDSNQNLGLGTSNATPTTGPSGGSIWGGKALFTVASSSNPGIWLYNTAQSHGYVLYNGGGAFQIWDTYGSGGGGRLSMSLGYGPTGPSLLLPGISSVMFPTSTLDVEGSVYVLSTSTFAGTFIANGANLSGISPTSLSGGIAFSSANYAFPLSLAVGSSTIVNLPQTLSVYGGGYFSGNVGIGTTAPSRPFQVVSTSTSPVIEAIGSLGAGNGIGFGVDGSGGYVQQSGATTPFRFYVNGASRFGIHYNGGVAFGSSYVGTNLGDGSAIFSGNVGIGTSTPASPLTIASNVSTLLELRGSNGASTVINMSNSGTGGRTYLLGSTGTGSAIGPAGSFGIYDNSGGSTRFLIASSGNVGIGTTTPTHSLTIIGTTPSLQVGDAFSYTPQKADFAVGSNNSNSRFLFGQSNGTYGGMTWNYNATIANAYLSITTNANNNNIVINPNGTGNVGIATTTPGYPLTVAGTIYSSSGGFKFPDGTVQSTAFGGGTQTTNAGYITPGTFGLSANNFGNYYFNSSITTSTRVLTIDAGNERVGIGASSPAFLLSVYSPQGGAASTNFSLGSGLTFDTQWSDYGRWGSGTQTVSGTVLYYTASPNLVSTLSQEGGVLAFRTGTSTGVGNVASLTQQFTILANGYVGIGVTNPQYGLDVNAGSTWQSKSVNIASGGLLTLNQVGVVRGDGSTYVGLGSTGAYDLLFYGGDPTARITIKSATGNVGIGTTTPTTAKLVISPGGSPAIDAGSQKIISLGYPAVSTDAASVQYVSDAITNAGITTSSSTSGYVLKTGDTMTGNLNFSCTAPGCNVSGVNKLYVTTIDPVYQIGGAKYATYVPNTIGQKSEVYGKAILANDQGQNRLDIRNLDLGIGAAPYKYIINFNDVEKGSDLWLFWQTIAEGKNMKDIEVMLTPQFNGRAWYELNSAQEQIIIHAEPADGAMFKHSTPIEVSYHLVAPRHDAGEWTNLVDTNEKGIPLNIK